MIIVTFLVYSHLGLLKWMKSEYLGMYSTTGALAVTIHLLDRPQSKYGLVHLTGSEGEFSSLSLIPGWGGPK